MAKASSKRGVLFVHYAASRNGAPMMLLHFLRWFKANGQRPFSILLNNGGELTPEFEEVADTFVAETSHWIPGGLRSVALTAAGLGRVARAAERTRLRKFAAMCPPGLIYLNAIASNNFRLIEALGLDAPLLTHGHEFGLLLRMQSGAAMPRIVRATRRFIACSGAVRNSLMREHGVRSERIEVVHEPISVENVQPRRSRSDVFRELEFPEDCAVVAACGNTGWNKGTDVFFQVARLVCMQRSRARFIWVGGAGEPSWVGGGDWAIPQHEHDARMVGIAEKVRFTGPAESPADYLAASDVFLLPSREDSFPLVCLEAAALGKPIVCFADAGGMPEFVEEDAGFVVPYLDLTAMASCIVALLDSSERRLTLGANAQRKVRERNDISKIAPQVAEVIEKTMRAG